jgi:predicted DNA-binding transcriptional regulator YafY
MPRPDRLFTLLQSLRDMQTHTALTLAQRTGVSLRTIYRDMEALAASGVPVTGTRGTGYRLADVITLPPLSLSASEFEALNLALAIAAEVADSDLRAAVDSLTAKLDAVLPETAIAQADAWKFARSPFGDATRGFALLPTLRAAIRARQKLRITYTSPGGTPNQRIIRPLHMENWNRVWTLTAWCEWRAAHRVFRLDLIRAAEALPELFADEPGKTLSDYRPNA